jgi:hypothetical protein
LPPQRGRPHRALQLCPPRFPGLGLSQGLKTRRA